MKRVVLRGAYALQGARLAFERGPLDVVVEDGRITAIEAAGAVQNVDDTYPARFP